MRQKYGLFTRKIKCTHLQSKHEYTITHLKDQIFGRPN